MCHQVQLLIDQATFHMRTSASATSDGECVVPFCVDVCERGDEGYVH